MTVLAACSQQSQKPEEIRPVRVIQVAPHLAHQTLTFAGEVRPRIESTLAFRVGGKLTMRMVETGTSVKAGQVLAKLDPTDLLLGQQVAKAQLAGAETDAKLAQADYRRYQDLKDKGFISQAELERRKAIFEAAQAKVAQAQANLTTQANQANYTQLTANKDGIITAIDAEVGQVVAPGQHVMRLAQTTEKEVVIGIPEDKVDSLKEVKQITVMLWASPDKTLPAVIREIAPAADPATRTYITKISVPNAPAAMHWGMTASVIFTLPMPAGAVMLPASALFHTQDRTVIWLLDQPSQTVKSSPVTVISPLDNDVLIKEPLSPGQMVVTAGVHLLREGQKVRVADDAISSRSNPSPTGKSM